MSAREELGAAAIPRETRVQRLLFLAGAGAAGLVLSTTGLLEPVAGGLVPACPMHTLTGLYCPACGGTRAVMRLLHLDLVGALHMNPLAVLAAPFAFFWFLNSPTLTTHWRRWQWMSFAAVLFAFAVFRNLPWYPFTLLAPPGQP